MSTPEKYKMWLAVRTDLEMSRYKLATQAGHAYQGLTFAALAQAQEKLIEYLKTGTPKITVAVKSEAELLRVHEEAEKAGIPVVLVTDEGRTEFGEPTSTVCAFGPWERDELPPFLKRLQLAKEKTE